MEVKDADGNGVTDTQEVQVLLDKQPAGGTAADPAEEEEVKARAEDQDQLQPPPTIESVRSIIGPKAGEAAAVAAGGRKLAPETAEVLHAALLAGANVAAEVPVVGPALSAALTLSVDLLQAVDAAVAHVQECVPIRAAVARTVMQLLELPVLVAAASGTPAAPASVATEIDVINTLWTGLLNDVVHFCHPSTSCGPASFWCAACAGGTFRTRYQASLEELAVAMDRIYRFASVTPLAQIQYPSGKQLLVGMLIPMAALEVEEQALAQGPSGPVFRGELDGAPVAVKLVSNVGRDSENVMCEAEVLRYLYHPNVLEFKGVVNEPSTLALVSEFMPGGSLEESLLNPQVPLSWKTRVQIAFQVANAMTYLHSMSVVHSDLRSAHVLLDAPGDAVSRVVVCDVGRNRVRSSFLQWMAPELLEDERASPSKASDVWSFGMLMRELAQRRHPFSDSLEAQTIVAFILLHAIPELSRACRCPVWFRQLMDLCCAHEASGRPTFEQIAQVLSQHLDDPDLAFDTPVEDPNLAAQAMAQNEDELSEIEMSQRRAQEDAEDEQ